MPAAYAPTPSPLVNAATSVAGPRTDRRLGQNGNRSNSLISFKNLSSQLNEYPAQNRVPAHITQRRRYSEYNVSAIAGRLVFGQLSESAGRRIHIDLSSLESARRNRGNSNLATRHLRVFSSKS